MNYSKLGVSLLIWVIGIVPLVHANPEKDVAAEEAAEQGSAGSRETSSDEEGSGEFVTEKRPDGTTVKYRKKTTYDFEGANIDGLYNKPSGSYISNIKDVKGRSIIRIRDNFDAEVVDSVRAIR